MANSYPAEIQVAFEKVLEEFDKEAPLSGNVLKYNPDPKQMHREGDETWLPQPMIETVGDGIDTTGITNDTQRLVVPCSLGQVKHVVADFDSLELRDDNSLDGWVEASKQALSAAVETAIAQRVAMTGAHVITRPGPLTGYDDLSLCEASLTEIGVPSGMRYMALNTRDKIGVASNLAARQTINGKPTEAMEESYIGRFAKFSTYDADVLPRIPATDAVGVTVNGAGQAHVPVASIETADGAKRNVDNRYYNLTVSDTSDIKPGDAFTIDGVNRVHLITKEDTAQPFVFRVRNIVSSTVIEVTAAIADGKYKNVTAAPADLAALDFINVATTQSNIFWHKNSVKLISGNLAVDKMKDLSPVMGRTEKSGIQIIMLKESNIDRVDMRFKFLMFFDVTNMNPLMNGILLANQ